MPEHLFLPLLLYPLWACYVIQTINGIIIVLNVIVIPVLTTTAFRPFLTSVN